MYCTECGTKNEKGSKFCENCGAKLEVEEDKKEETKEDKEVKTNKKEAKKKDKSPKKKSNKKALIITLIVILVLGVVGILGYKYYLENKSTGSTWGDEYYKYLKDNTDKIEDNSKVSFIDIKEIKEPIMLIINKKNKDKYTNIYYIKNNKVKEITSNTPEEIKLLYNIEKKKYIWYLRNKENKKENYVPVINTINDKTTEKEYTYKNNEEITQDKLNGEKITISKKDTELIDTNIKLKEQDLTKDIKTSDLQKTIEESVSNYKKTDNLLTKDVKDTVKKEIKEVEDKQKEIEAAKKEIDDDKKKKEEEANSQATIDNYIMKYGTYRGVSNYGGENNYNVTFVLRKDGTYTYTNPDWNGINAVETGTYELKETDMGDSRDSNGNHISEMGASICFHPTNTNIPSEKLYVDKGASDECFRIKGNNNFDGVQYSNEFKLQS